MAIQVAVLRSSQFAPFVFETRAGAFTPNEVPGTSLYYGVCTVMSVPDTVQYFNHKPISRRQFTARPSDLEFFLFLIPPCACLSLFFRWSCLNTGLLISFIRHSLFWSFSWVLGVQRSLESTSLLDSSLTELPPDLPRIGQQHLDWIQEEKKRCHSLQRSPPTGHIKLLYNSSYTTPVVMSPRENGTATSARRHPSLSFRSHPRTTTLPTPISKDSACALEAFHEPLLTELCQEDHAPVVEDMDPFPNAVPRRRGAKSFSTLKHPMEGLVALGRRWSVSLRHKSSKQNITEHVATDGDQDQHYVPTSKHKRMASGSWDARSTKVAWQGCVNRRPSLNSVSALHGFYAPTASIPAPIPGRGSEPPVFPNHVFSGAAARAAAAAQNEQMEMTRTAKAERESNKILEMRIPQDSESGIGIDLRDRSEMPEAELFGLARLGRCLSNESAFCPN